MYSDSRMTNNNIAIKIITLKDANKGIIDWYSYRNFGFLLQEKEINHKLKEKLKKHWEKI